MIQNNNQIKPDAQSLQMAVGSSAFSLLECLDIDPLRFYKIDEYDDEEEIEKTEFEELLSKQQKCVFEIYVEINYSVPIDFDSNEKKCDSNGFFEDCYYFPFLPETLIILSELGYDENYLKNWVKQYYGKPDYEEIWDGETLYDEDYFDDGDEKNYQCVWKVYGEFKIEFFND